MGGNIDAIAKLFASGTPARTLFVPGGQQLYRAGDQPDALFLVEAGSFGAFRSVAGGPASLLGVIRPGELVGESALLAGTPRSSTVVALRDSVVAVMPRDQFFFAARHSSEVMGELARLLIRRAGNAGPAVAAPRVFAIAALSPRAGAARLARSLGAAMLAAGHTVAVLDASATDQPPGWWSRVEEDHDFVLCAAEWSEQGWAATCRRQADRLLLLANGTERPQRDGRLGDSEPLQANGLVDLVLEHDDRHPSGTAAWLTFVEPRRHFHLTPGGGVDRLARVLTGTAVALALSGGGARAFAHVGAVAALRRAEVPIDAVCGTSMGAIVAAGVAAGWSDEELDRRLRDAFVTTSPLDDVAWPFVAMTGGAKVDRRLAEHFGEADIADLPLPFFCMSTDLAEGEAVAHRSGSLATALRASIALPGILPPVTLGGRVLVDGGVLRNLPTETLRSEHAGTIVAVDVSRSMGLMPEDVVRPSPLTRWFWSGAWRRGPPIVSILMRSATIAAGPDLIASRAAADLYVMPEVGDIEIRNWRAYDRAVRAGVEAMSAALDALDIPVPHLRRERLRAAAVEPM